MTSQINLDRGTEHDDQEMSSLHPHRLPVMHDAPHQETTWGLHCQQHTSHTCTCELGLTCATKSVRGRELGRGKWRRIWAGAVLQAGGIVGQKQTDTQWAPPLAALGCKKHQAFGTVCNPIGLNSQQLRRH
jgi:hypothetical protein